jgi:hypothetical protein
MAGSDDYIKLNINFSDDWGRSGTYRGETVAHHAGKDYRNIPNGQGVFTGEDKYAGFEYNGKWENGKWHGQGKLVLGDTGKGSFEGIFEKGNIKHGTYRHKDGKRVFQGEFDGQWFPQHGLGTGIDGVVFEVDGRAHGQKKAYAHEDEFWSFRGTA